MEVCEKEYPVNGYPPVIEILIWHCHGMTCDECGYEFSQKCSFRNIINEHNKIGVFCAEPSLN
jgi:hypothetical protein